MLITGANGSLGSQLLATLAGEPTTGGRAAAVVRSTTAAESLMTLPACARPDTHIVDYRDTDGLAKAMEGRRHIVHLVGILKESSRSRYEEAHEKATVAVADAALRSGVERVVYLSILGASADSNNACLASKGRAENLLLDHDVPATVLRLPMVLGSGDHASDALHARANARFSFMIDGGRSLEQPIDADNVVSAILSALIEPSVENRALDLAGPESVQARVLLMRAAALFGRTPRIISVPNGLARFGVRLLERVTSEPPITSDMLDVLLHDDHIDPESVAHALDLRLTSLDTMLARRVGPNASPGDNP